MKILKRKQILTEAKQKVEEAPIEPSVEEIIAAIADGKMSIEDVEAAHANGEISDENYQAVMSEIEAQQNEQMVQDILEKINSGELAVEDLDTSLANGEIPEEVYTAVMQQITDDPNMAEGGEEQPMEEPQPIVGTYNNVRLYDHFLALKEYISTYKSAYTDIEVDQLTKFQVDRLAGLYGNIRRLETDVVFYLNNSFANEDYKKNLYTYLLFNKQFADEISKFRRILNLNPKDITPEEKEKKSK